MVLGELPVPGRPITLAVGADGGCLDFFTLLFPFLLGVVFGGRVVRWCWVNFQCRGVLQFGLQYGLIGWLVVLGLTAF